MAYSEGFFSGLFEGDHLARGSGLRGRCGQDYVGKEVGMIIDLAHLGLPPCPPRDGAVAVV